MRKYVKKIMSLTRTSKVAKKVAKTKTTPSKKIKLRQRNAAKAIIIKQDKILVICKERNGNSWYTLPGGSQKRGETLQATLLREVLEETGEAVRIMRLKCIIEQQQSSIPFLKSCKANQHRLNFFFICSFIRKQVKLVPIKKDASQTGLEWLPIKSLDKKPFYPRELIRLLCDQNVYGTYMCQ